MLRVVNGARALDGTNSAPDIAHVDRTNTTTNSTSVDMSGFNELLFHAQTGVVDADQVLTVTVQESNEAAANFANIAGASFTFNGAASSNLAKFGSVNWRNPARKRYARLQGIAGATNSAAYGASTLRVQPISGPVNSDAGFAVVN